LLFHQLINWKEMTYLWTRLQRFLYPSEVAKEDSPLRFGVLGAAKITPYALINTVRQLPNAVVVSVAARDHERAKAFATKYGIPTTHVTYDEVIHDDNVDAVYIPLPNGLHYEWAAKAIRAKKHVLLEKPATSNAQQAAHLAQLAAEHGVHLMEAFHWQFHPAAQKVIQLVQSGRVGTVQEIHTRFVIPAVAMPRTDIRFDYALAGGAMMDAGSYAVNATRVMGRAALGAFVEPVVVDKAEAVVVMENIDDTIRGEYVLHSQLDPTRSIKVSMEASLQGGLCESGMPTITIIGDQGTLVFKNFIGPFVYHYITVNNETIYEYGDGGSTFMYMVKQFVNKCQGKETTWWVDNEDTVGNMALMDAIYIKAGMTPRPGKVD
jgi:predicted dehydrogenase